MLPPVTMLSPGKSPTPSRHLFHTLPTQTREIIPDSSCCQVLPRPSDDSDQKKACRRWCSGCEWGWRRGCIPGEGTSGSNKQLHGTAWDWCGRTGPARQPGQRRVSRGPRKHGILPGVCLLRAWGRTSTYRNRQDCLFSSSHTKKSRIKRQWAT